jgi:cytolysin-activating lysine-acyltransferase
VKLICKRNRATVLSLRGQAATKKIANRLSRQAGPTEFEGPGFAGFSLSPVLRYTQKKARRDSRFSFRLTYYNTPAADPMTQEADPTDSSLSEDELRHLADLVKTQAKSAIGQLPLLGPVAWLMMRHPNTRHMSLSDLEWRVMPALVLEQAKLFMREGMPLAFVSWARLSEDAALRFRTAPHRLAQADWQSGGQVWLVDVFTPFGGAAELIKDLRENVFSGEAVYQLGPVMGDGLAQPVIWEALVPALAAEPAA